MDIYDKENLPAILDGHGDWFNAHLIRLIAKADGYNREKLWVAFPTVVEAVEAHLKCTVLRQQNQG